MPFNELSVKPYSPDQRILWSFLLKKTWTDYAVKAVQDTHTFYKTAATTNLLGMLKMNTNKEVIWIQLIQKMDTSESMSEFICDREY